jgi:cell division protein FtsZ
MGTGYGTGERRALEAAEMAINSPLLEDLKVDGATGILINITGGPDMTMKEVSDAVTMIEDSADEDAHIIFGYVTLEEPCDEIKCTVIATGFGSNEIMMNPQRVKRASYGPPKSEYYNIAGSSGSSAVRNSVNVRRQDESGVQKVGVAGDGGRSTTIPPRSIIDNHYDIPAYIRKHGSE